MFSYSRTILLQRTSRSTYWSNLKTISIPVYYNHTISNSLSLSIWRRKKEMGKEGLIIAKELKKLESSPARLDHFINSHFSRLLKSDLVSIPFEFQRQDLVFLSMKLYEVVRKEIWYRPDMFFYRDMLMMLARNKKVNEVNRVWQDLKNEEGVTPERGREARWRPQGCDGETKGRCWLVGVTVAASRSKSNRKKMEDWKRMMVMIGGHGVRDQDATHEEEPKKI
ncbi:hypothetical protein R6Q57_007337 [Mikania cordata]